MLFTFSVCKKCRQALFRQFHISLSAQRSAKPQKAYRKSMARAMTHDPIPSFPPRSTAVLPPKRGSKTRVTQAMTPAPTPETVRSLLLRYLPSWKTSTQTIARLSSIGLAPMEIRGLLEEYERHIIGEIKSQRLHGKDPWSIAHLLNQRTVNERIIVDRVLTMRLFAFVAQPGICIKGVSEHSMRTLQQADEAFDLRYPPEYFPLARQLRRKVILHVGPTNSGKTYNALRALATANSGVYAGPLRLLAHEVWERLNRGSIRPHDTDPAEAHQYARQCNLVTGEEQRIVSPSAPLISCTVEMVNLFSRYSVCVIDEIQMIADPDRGHAWTSALLGVAADEVHLCGEESTVPLITELVQDMGDDLEVKRYQRLTPLVVADKSLEGRWDRIQKGDCVVTFSRTGIFSLKRIVEEATGLRCAVAYGRLPPETRTEQATLFNATDTGYDVMVASDAIGMGLNLKIKRVVFVQLTKFNGMREVPLSLSQIKQIGGRAGRFGEHGDSSSVGIVTCLTPNDLPILKMAFSNEVPILRQACLPLHVSILHKVAQLLPPSFGLKALHSTMAVAARIGKNYSLPGFEWKVTAMETIDRCGRDLQLFEKVQFVTAPVAWQQGVELEIFVQYLRQFVKGGTVDICKTLESSGLLDTLEEVSKARLYHEMPSKVLGTAIGSDVQPEASPVELGAATGYGTQTPATLGVLETLHKVLVAYVWLSFRIPVSFDQRDQAMDLKEETEKGIQFVLEGITNVREQQAQHAKSMRQLRVDRVETPIDYTLPKARVPRILQRAGLAPG